MNAEVETGGGDVIAGAVVLQAKDLKRAIAAAPQIRKVKVFLAAGVLIALAQVGGTFWSIGSVGLSNLTFLPMMAFAYVVVWFSPKFTAQRQFRAMNDEQKALTYRLDSLGFCVESPHSSSQVHWIDVQRYVEGPECFLLFTNPHVGSLLAKRAFAPADVDRVRDLLRRRVTPRAPKRGVWTVVVLWAALVVVLLATWLTFSKSP